MKTFEMNVKNAKKLTNTVWTNFVGEDMHPKTLDAWFNAKNEYLTGMFGDELMLKKEVTVEQPFEAMTGALNVFRNEVMRHIRQEKWFKEVESFDLLCEMRNFISLRSLYENKARETVSFGEKRKFNKGEKLTRGLKKLITNPDVVNELQIEYSQIMNTKKLTGTLCLSIHPMDFLTMSHTRSWNSCYDVFNDGEYRAGALEFMCSNNTICAYLYTKEMRVEGEDWNDKKWRSIITVEPNEFIMTGKNYPYQSSELTGLVYEWVRELTGDAESYPDFDKERVLDNMDYDVSIEYGYNDAENGSAECFTVGVNTKSKNPTHIYASYGKVPCPKCGEEYDMEGEAIFCVHCDDSCYCESCDDRISGERYEVINRWGERITVCYCCFDDYYRLCDSCEEYHYCEDLTEINGRDYCEECRDDKFSCCNECDEYVETVKEYKGDYLCEDCYDNRVEEDKEEEEEEA